ncbi:PAS-domain containing protein [Dinoroseobacter sp. S76]|uniref:hybrid sensor histidine kinase/response regulator n=1 Tax=Dinoroseobacter sp. S76 TaxID=3415124 RepID=UPI003C7D4C1A
MPDTIDTLSDMLGISDHDWSGPVWHKAERMSETRFDVDGDAALALLEDTFSGIDYGIALLDENMNFVLFNEKYVETAFADGLVPKIGDNAGDLAVKQLATGTYVVPEDLTPEEMTAGLLEAVKGCQSDIVLPLTDGRTLMASSKRTALGGYLLSIEDVTIRMEAREAEEARRRELISAFDALQEGVALWDAEFRFLMCNDNYMRMITPYRDTPWEVGAPAESCISEAFRSGAFVIPEGVSEAEWIEGYMSWARNFGGAIEINFKDGRTISASAKQTNLGGVLITTLDVTEERNSEARARQLLFDAMESLDEGFAIWGSDMTFLTCNQRYVDMILSYRGSPFEVGTPVADCVRDIYRAGVVVLPPGVTEEMIVADMEDWVRSFGEGREFVFTDGRIVMTNIKPTNLGGFMVTALDITEERNSMARARDMLSDAIEALEEGFVLVDENLCFIFANSAWIEIMGDTQPAAMLAPGESLSAALEAQIAAGFFAIPERQGQQAYSDWLINGFARPGREMHFASAAGRQFIGKAHATAFGGSLIQIQDVTDQLALEEELTQQRETAHQTEKLSALGELLAGVAHELNNPLSVVFGYSQMLQGKIEDPAMAERMDMICQSSERAAKIVRTFLAMARQRPTKTEICSLNDIVETALEVSSYSLKTSGTVVEVDLDPGAPRVLGDFDQLAQVFSNLIVNAGHAVRSKGSAGRITLRSRVLGAKVRIEIADNGHGIPEEIQSRIFEPFFTTKDVGEGTGIGLAFSHRIVQSHEGALTVRSKIGKGTQFFVSLPCSKTAPFPILTAPKVIEARRILVVDDEDVVARLIGDMLTEEGFSVTCTTDPRSALRMAEAEPFDAILSDFKMPEMNGETFYRALEAIAPENAGRTGFITGDAMSAQVVLFLERSKRPYIEKPIVKPELLALIARAAGEEH